MRPHTARSLDAIPMEWTASHCNDRPCCDDETTSGWADAPFALTMVERRLCP